MLNYLIDHRAAEETASTGLAILSDYYVLHLLALLSLRIWDEGDADENLDHLTELLGELQGPNGSGQAFVENAETLILVATSHYELDERGFEPLLAKVKTLNQSHRMKIALGHAASLGSHLRFGFVVKGTVVDALLRGDPWTLTFNDLLTGIPCGDRAGASRETLAKTLMGYARASPDRIRGRLMPVIVYDPWTGHQAFSVTMRKLKE